MALSDAEPFAAVFLPLSEASGSRADSIGAATLTDNNTVGSATGVFGTAADFEADNSEYLSCSDNADVSGADIDMTFRFLFRLESQTGTRTLFHHAIGDVSSYDGYTCYESGGTINFGVYDGSSRTLVSVSGLTTGVDYLVHCKHDATANQVGIAVNAGTESTASHTGGMNNSSGIFYLGTDGSGGRFHDGLMEEFVILRGYALNGTERSEDYNSGSFKSFTTWAGGGGASIPMAIFRRPMRFFKQMR